MKLAFLASNRGSAMRAVCEAATTSYLRAEVVLVVSNKAASDALAFARRQRIPALAIPTLPDPAQSDAQLCDALSVAEAELVILSGYLRKLGPITLARFGGRILNTHPALLPRFGGHGMYGRRVHQAVKAAGEAVTGATVHLVDAEYDQGPILAQRQVRIDDGADVETIEQRVMAAEGALLVEILVRLASGERLLPAVRAQSAPAAVPPTSGR